MAVHQVTLICGRDLSSGEPVPFANNRGALDVFIQDQNSEIVNWIMHQDLNDIVLLEHATVNSRTIEVQNTPAHNIVVGNIISLLQDTKFYQGFVTAVSGTTITLDTPIDKQFRSDRDYTATRGTANLAVDGSVTSQIFHAKPPSNQSWDITELVVYMIDNAAMDDTTIGGIAAVTNGIVLREKNGVYNNIGNIKKNGDLKAAGCSVLYAEKVGGGEYSVQSVCSFSNDAGVTVRLNGSLNEEIEAIVQDKLDAISTIVVSIIGHVVE